MFGRQQGLGFTEGSCTKDSGLIFRKDGHAVGVSIIATMMVELEFQIQLKLILVMSLAEMLETLCGDYVVALCRIHILWVVKSY